MKLTKSLKLTIIVTLLVSVVSIVILTLTGIKVGNPYQNTVEVAIDFSQDVEFDQVSTALSQVKQFETLEKQSGQEYLVTYYSLEQQQKDDIQSNLIELDSEVSVQSTEKSKVNRDLEFLYFFIPLLFLLILVGTYLLTSEIKKSRNKWGVSVSTILYLVILAAATLAMFSAFSLWEKLSYTGIVFLGGLLIADILFTAIMLMRLNAYLRNSMQKNFMNSVINFAEKYDESYVVFQLIALLVLFPLVLVSDRAIEYGVILVLTIVLNIYMQTYGFVHCFLLWQLALDHLPIIKKLKWTRR